MNEELHDAHGPLAWRRASYSGANHHCVEAACAGNDDWVVRDSKNPAAAPLRFTRRRWDAFLRDVKLDRYDL